MALELERSNAAAIKEVKEAKVAEEERKGGGSSELSLVVEDIDAKDDMASSPADNIPSKSSALTLETTETKSAASSDFAPVIKVETEEKEESK